MNKQIVLSIQEIADLKEGRKTLKQITKTHDGTSMSNLKIPLKNFIDKYSQIYAVTVEVYDENGKKQYTHQSPVNIPLNSKKTNRLKKENQSNCHYIQNATTRGDANKPHLPTRKNGYLDSFGEWERDELIDKNNNGDYLYRSVTLVSTNGSTISLIRNNKFNQEDEQAFLTTYDNMVKKCKDYESDLDKHMYDRVYDENGRLRYVEKEDFDMKQYISKNGDGYDILKDFQEDFSKANVKLRIQKEYN